jgi:putative ABC transport system ATP-binding protein
MSASEASATREGDASAAASGTAPASGTVPGAVSVSSPLVAARDLKRAFGSGRTAVHALRGVSFDIEPGELVALRGRSGSGKTTLLNIVGGLDRPTSGTVTVDGHELSTMSEAQRLRLRRSTVAFVFQSFGLLPALSAAENVGVPLRVLGADPRLREERVALLLDVVGLGEHASQRPNELSGGQQQRVAIARALAAAPRLIIADEPTGQLDADTGRHIMRLLRTVVRAEHATALVATHDSTLIDLADRVLELHDGVITER